MQQNFALCMSDVIFTLSLLKDPVIRFLRELRVRLTLVPFSERSGRSSSSSSFLQITNQNVIQHIFLKTTPSNKNMQRQATYSLERNSYHVTFPPDSFLSVLEVLCLKENPGYLQRSDLFEFSARFLLTISACLRSRHVRNGLLSYYTFLHYFSIKVWIGCIAAYFNAY